MYDLFTDGLQDLKDLLIFRTEKFSYQGMLGLTSGSNQLFQTPHHPLLSAATTTIYLSGVALSSGSYTLDTETGMARFASAPSEGVQPEATYYRCDYSDTQLKQILWAAFRQMEMRWRRSLRLSSSSVSYAAATIRSAYAYLCDDDELIDPVISGSIVFSTSHVQTGLLLAIAQLILTQQERDQAAKTAISFREDRGMAMDRSKIPDALSQAVAYQEKLVTDALREAQRENYGTEHPGGFISREPSDDYTHNFAWDEDAE